jgi:hypothetical protein
LGIALSSLLSVNRWFPFSWRDNAMLGPSFKGRVLDSHISENPVWRATDSAISFHAGLNCHQQYTDLSSVSA